MKKYEFNRVVVSIIVLLGGSNCGDDFVPFPQGQFGDDTGIVDTGFPEHDLGSGLIKPGECLTNGVSGVGGTAVGYKYQCNGVFGATFTYTYDGVDFPLQIPDIFGGSDPIESLFGEGYDTYWSPKVMACCGEYDDELDFNEQPQFALNCIMDARETACYSAVHALQKEFNSLPNGGRKDAVEEMIAHVFTDSGLTDCVDGLGENFPTPWLPTIHGALWEIDHSWVTTDLEAAELEYGVWLQNFVSWPEYDYPNLMETCTDLSENNLMVFDDIEPPLAYQAHVLLEEADGELDGPHHEGGHVASIAGFASEFNSCADPLCSYALLSEDSSNNWAIDEMMLFVDGYFTIDNGTTYVTMDRAYLELSGQAMGTWKNVVGGPTVYEVAAGDAVFIAGGSAGSDSGFLTVSNSTAITAVNLSGEWHFSSFDIQYDDPTYGVFTLTVSGATWVEG